MSVQEIMLGGGGVLIALMTLVQIVPLKIKPWSAIGRAIGKVLNGDVIKRLDRVQQKLDGHIQVDDERNADLHRIQILRFNRELLQGTPHTQEDFVEALSEIDFYENYCDEHKDYKNNRATLAIKNIKRAYMDWLENYK